MEQAWTHGGRDGRWRSRSARWPRSARLATWALVALIGLTVLGGAVGEDRTEARTTASTSTTPEPEPVRPFTSEVKRPPTTSVSTTTTVTPTTTATTVAPATTAPVPTTTWAPPPAEPPAGAPAGGFANCAAARAAGAAPVHIGGPGYAPRLDGDGDGVGCE